MKIKGSHDSWVKSQYFCVNCGKQEVWESDGFDYYDGNDHCCVACGWHFNHPRADGDNKVTERLIQAIKETQCPT